MEPTRISPATLPLSQFTEEERAAACPPRHEPSPSEPPTAVRVLVAEHTPSPPKDWCGSQGTEWVPDGAFGVDWSDACRAHDECYGTAGANKFLCDYNLSQDMSLACAAQDGGMLCHIVAGIYFHGVRTPQGDEAFERAQALAKERAE